MSGVKKVLEIGTAIGYSAINFAEFLGEGGTVTTIERDEKYADAAEENIHLRGLDGKIRVRRGDANEVLDSLAEEYDCIFLDAAKGQYINFLPKCERLLKKGGILISDNVLYRGSVALDGFIPRKHRTIIRNLKQYIEEISRRFDTTVLPIGDGVAVSIVK